MRPYSNTPVPRFDVRNRATARSIPLARFGVARRRSLASASARTWGRPAAALILVATLMPHSAAAVKRARVERGKEGDHRLSPAMRSSRHLLTRHIPIAHPRLDRVVEESVARLMRRHLPGAFRERVRELPEATPRTETREMPVTLAAVGRGRDETRLIPLVARFTAEVQEDSGYSSIVTERAETGDMRIVVDHLQDQRVVARGVELPGELGQAVLGARPTLAQELVSGFNQMQAAGQEHHHLKMSGAVNAGGYTTVTGTLSEARGNPVSFSDRFDHRHVIAHEIEEALAAEAAALFGADVVVVRAR